MNKAWLGILPLIGFVGLASATPVENFRLLDMNGESHELYRHKNANAVVLMVNMLGCPIVAEAIPPLNQVAEEFKGKGVDFFMINSRSIDTPSELIKQSTEFKNTIPVLLDSTQVVARSLAFTRSAEVFVLDPKTWSILYRGPLDDGNRGYGTDRTDAKDEYLKQALTAVLANHTDQIPKSMAPLGCLLDLDKGKVPSYARDVVPLLTKKCIGCHDGRNSRAWRMTDYETVKHWSPMIRETVMTRTMPPYWPDLKVSQFTDQGGSLTEHEQSVLFNWIEAGSPRGKGADPLVKNRPAPPKPDLVVKLAHKIEIPPTGVLEYQYVKLNLDTSKKDIYLRGISAMNQLASFHHMAALVIPPSVEHSGDHKTFRENRDFMYMDWLRRFDGSAYEAPYAFKVPKGYSVYLELHLKTIGHPVTFDPDIGLSFAKGKPSQMRALQVMSARKKDFVIPAEAANFPVNFETTPFQHPVDIVALRPHMHLRGKSMKVSAILPDGEKKLIASFPDFKPFWIKSFQFKKPVHLQAGTKLFVEGVFDNSEQNPFNPAPKKDVKRGPFRKDEMFICHVYFYDEKVPRSFELDPEWKSEFPKSVDDGSDSM